VIGRGQERGARLARRVSTAAATGRRRLAGHRSGRILLELLVSTGRNDLSGVAAEMAFRLTFAVPPLLLLVLAVAGLGQQLVNRDLTSQILALLARVLPEQVMQPLGSVVAQLLAADPLGLGLVGIVGAVWGGSGAAKTLMKGLDRAYGTTRRPFWRAQLVAVLATLMLPVLAVGGIVAYLFTGDLVEPVGRFFGISQASLSLWQNLRWPIVLISVVGGLWLIYRLLPHVQQSWRGSLPGALLAAVGWLILARGFEFYLQHLAGIPAAVGSLGLAMVVLAWLYAVGLVMLFGAEFNAAIRRGWRPPTQAATNP
jgi:membrane protein